MQEYKMPIRPQNSNKSTFGKVLNVSGSGNYTGASYLSTYAILKVGAGYAALASEKNVIQTVSTMLPEAVYLDTSEGLKRINDFTVLLIGCGLGKTPKSRRIFERYIKNAKNIPTVIDADGLNILSELSHLTLPDKCVITPHPMEASRLLGVNINEILSDFEGSAKKLSKKYNCVTVLKTHRTIITDGEQIFINQHGNSALAKAGSGDVLAGIISGLIAQKVDIYEASKLGVYLHSRAGEIASEQLTEYSVLASDIIKYLPDAIKEIL